MPASAAAIPPWVGQPADPAAHYAQGYQIGVHVGAQQAAQAFQQQQLALQQRKELMAQQQQAVEDEMNTQVLNLKAAETARKFQANQEFRARVGAGEDPASVLMQLAPDLGESPAAILHNQALRDQQRAMMDFREANAQRLGTQFQKSLEERQREADLRLRDKPSVAPNVQVIGGREFVVNPKTGHFQELDKSVNRSSFIAQNVMRLLQTGTVSDENEAAKRLGDFYDKNLQKQDQAKDDWLEAFQEDWEQASNVDSDKDPLNIRSLLK